MSPRLVGRWFEDVRTVRSQPQMPSINFAEFDRKGELAAATARWAVVVARGGA